MKNFHIVTFVWEYLSSKKSRDSFLLNLKSNWLFSISAAVFFYLNMKYSIGDFIGFLIAFGMILLLSSLISNIFQKMMKKNIYILFFSILSSIGVCIENGSMFYKYWNRSEVINLISNFHSFQHNPIKIVTVILIVVSIYFVAIIIDVILNYIIESLEKSKILSNTSIIELISYILIFAIFVITMFYIFNLTQAFYGTDNMYNVIYTSDSPALVKEKVYAYLKHTENDLRQPLFAIFSAPFTGFVYLINRIFHTSATINAFLINVCQLALMFLANILLANLLQLNRIKRIIFVFFVSCTYTSLLFSVMMEQYIFAYFWLIFVIFEIMVYSRPSFISMNAAIGTLITSASILVSSKQKKESVFHFIKELILTGVDFLILLLLFDRFDIIYNIKEKIIQLSGFSGEHITFQNKLAQFTYFIHDLFIGPNTATRITTENNWHLAPIGDYSIIGIGILVIVLISVLINYRDKMSLIAGFWVFFSVVMLLILGWGTQENGLILYALYFGWAYFILIYRFVEKFAKIFRISFIVPLVFCIAILVLLYKNVPAMMDMIKFAVQAYPV